MKDKLHAASGGRLTSLVGNEEEPIGSGSYGTVHPAKLYDDELVAVKWYSSEDVQFHEQSHMHWYKGLPHIVNIIEAGQGTYIAMEIAYNGSLQSFCDAVPDMTCIPLSVRMMIARDICAGLYAMHNGLGLAHEDLKPGNVLLDYGLRAKLCDFGSAVPLSHPVFAKESGTEAYWSPEKREFIIEGVTTGYDRMKADFFSLGCILEEALELRLLSNPLSLKHNDPIKRPEWPTVLNALGERSFNYKEDQLGGLTEAELVNMAYNWTSLGGDCCENLTQGRKSFCSSRFWKAFKALQACLDLCDPEDNIVTRLLMGTLLIYGLGTKVDMKNALDLLQEANNHLEDVLHKPHYVQEFTQYLMVLAEEEEDVIEKSLTTLAEKGNPLAQNSLSRLWWLNSINKNWKSLEPDEGHTNQNQFLLNSMSFLCKAAKSGFALSQSTLTVMFWLNNTAKVATMKREGNGIALPTHERRFLKDASESGSLMAHLLLGVVNNTLDKEALEKSARLDIFKFLAKVYKLVGDELQAVEWLHIGAYKFSDAECLHEVGVLLSDYHCLEEALNQGSYRLSAFECAILLQREGREPEAVCLAKHHLSILLEEDEKSSRDADSLSLHKKIITEALNLLLRLEERSEGCKAAWYSLILSLQGKLSGHCLANVGLHYMSQKDFPKAERWLSTSFEQGYISSASSLGALCEDMVAREEWWKRGEAQGCPICLHHLMENSKDQKQQELYLLKGCKEHKSSVFIYRYALHLLDRVQSGEADDECRDAAFQTLHRAIKCGFEDAAFFMAVRAKDNAKDTEYWMARYLRNISSDYTAHLGACLHMEDPLGLLLGFDKEGSLPPAAFWRLGAYYMLAQQEEKALFYFLKGVARQELKCWLLYGQLLLQGGAVKQAIPCFFYALAKGVAISECAQGMTQCLRCLESMPANSLIVFLIFAAMDFISIEPVNPHQQAGSSAGFEYDLFKKLVRDLPDFEAEDEDVLSLVLLTDIEKLEQEKIVRMYTQKKKSLASRYILSMFYAGTTIGHLVSLKWLIEAIRKDPQLSLVVESPSSLGQELKALFGDDTFAYVEKAIPVFLNDDDVVRTILARQFSMCCCKVAQSMSKHRPDSVTAVVVGALFELACSRSCIRGLLVSLHLKEQPTSATTVTMNVEINYARAFFGLYGMPSKIVTLLIPRREFQAFLPRDNGEDKMTVQVRVTVNIVQGTSQVEMICVDDVSLDLEPSLQPYLQALRIVWHEGYLPRALL